MGQFIPDRLFWARSGSRTPRRSVVVTDLSGLYAITPDGLPVSICWHASKPPWPAVAAGCSYATRRSRRLNCWWAHALRALTRRYGARLIVNDDLVLALLVDADGVHLGKDDGDWRLARAILGPERLLGVSCYADLARAQAAVAAGADYVAFGAVFPSLTKPQAALLPTHFIAQAKAALPVPLCAIGGITLDNAPLCLPMAPTCLAVIHDLFAAPDIAGRAAHYQQLFTKATS